MEKDDEDVADAQEALRRADLFTSVTLVLLNQSCAETFPAPSTPSSANFKRCWSALKPQAT